MKRIKLTNNRWIGESEYPFIIAEIGNNHNGSLDLAFKLIDSAKNLGLDGVKFQVKDIELAFSKDLLDSPYTGPNSFGKTYREHKQFLEFSYDELKKIYDYAAKQNILCFSTPFDTKSVELLEKLNNPIYKISSFHLTDLKLIESVCRTGKPILMSTGMSTLEEIDIAMNLIKKYTDNVVLLHCVSCYPSNDEDINLRVIPMLRKKYNCLVGYSGHERGVAISTVAIALGACIIERHFTLDRTTKGPDHASSVEPEGMQLIVSRAKRIFNAMGSSEKKVLDCELPNRIKFRGR